MAAGLTKCVCPARVCRCALGSSAANASAEWCSQGGLFAPSMTRVGTSTRKRSAGSGFPAPVPAMTWPSWTIVSAAAHRRAHAGSTRVSAMRGAGKAAASAYGYRPLAAALAMAAGRGVLVPDFRLAPEHPFPAALDDALAAYRWLAGQRGGASEVVLAGDSSGAGLALAVLLSLKADGEAMPAGAA